jgi:hypothetical protein
MCASCSSPFPAFSLSYLLFVIIHHLSPLHYGNVANLPCVYSITRPSYALLFFLRMTHPSLYNFISPNLDFSWVECLASPFNRTLKARAAALQFLKMSPSYLPPHTSRSTGIHLDRAFKYVTSRISVLFFAKVCFLLYQSHSSSPYDTVATDYTAPRIAGFRNPSFLCSLYTPQNSSSCVQRAIFLPSSLYR